MILLEDRVGNVSLICKISLILIFKAWVYNFLLLIILVNLFLFDLDELKGGVGVLEVVIGVLEVVIDFIINWDNIHFWKDLLLLFIKWAYSIQIYKWC